MTFDEWWEDFVAEHDDWKYADSAALRRAAFQAGAASRDNYIELLETGLLQVRKALCGDIHNTDDLLDLIASRDAEIAELVAALKPFGAIDLVESRLPAEFAMLILRARAAIAKLKGQDNDNHK